MSPGTALSGRSGERMSSPGVVVNYSVPETARGVRYHGGPVPHRVELVEAAGLKPRGHHKEVGARSDKVRETLIKDDDALMGGRQ